MTSRFLVGDEGGLYMEREAQVLTGLVEHVLPRVGSHTLSLDLAHGKAVSNAIVSLLYTVSVEMVVFPLERYALGPQLKI